MKVKDLAGKEVQGVYRGKNGALVVNNDVEYKKYIQFKRQQEDINNYKNEVSTLKQSVLDVTTQVNSLAGEMAEVKDLLKTLTASLTNRS